MRKVVVVGLDGFEPTIVESMLAAAELPHLARLRLAGGYARLQTTHPAQTPVAWSSFATGANPGVHGIFDFVRRDPRTYSPDLSLNRYEQKNAFVPPRAVNLRRGTAVWKVLSEAGVPSVVLRFPCTFPPDDIRGRMLSGMGVPDVRGGLGTSSFYTSGANVHAAENEHVISVHPESGGHVSTYIVGPRNPATRTDFRFPMTLEPRPEKKTLVVRCDGQPSALEVREGEWSDWLKVKFKTGLLQSVSGMVRFHLVRLAPVLELYASPVNFDPATPIFPISSPAGYARELMQQIGTFYTTGMVEDHGGLNNGRFDESAYLAQCDGVLRERLRMLRYELDRFREGFLFCLFDTPDRLQHMFWRDREDRLDHSVPAPASRIIAEHYRACDAVVGEALRHDDGDTLYIVLSDHGMKSFRRGVHLNTWLHDQGLLTLRRGLEPGEDAADLLRSVDWERTRAYALGLSGIYLNLQGREGRGIVRPDEVDGLTTRLVTALTGLADPKFDRPAVRRVLTREQLYRGPHASESPDVVVDFADGYRVSWGTALGAVPAGQFEDNIKKWSGDHLMDPSLVPGVLFMNRPFTGGAASLLDMAPTILTALGVPGASAMEGSSLLV